MATNASQNQKIGRLNTRAQRESSRWIAPPPFFSLFATRPIVLHYLIHPSSTSTSDLASPSNCPQRVSAFTREYQGKRIDTIDHKKGQVFIIDQGSCQISRRFHRAPPRLCVWSSGDFSFIDAPNFQNGKSGISSSTGIVGICAVVCIFAAFSPQRKASLKSLSQGKHC